ncbi:MAG: PD40 domain-containing protein [Candidatus Omnitrophica bacterium]|nr:PD40 domain-containing protein [Candidatus Omnitrophota bacterium]
MKPNNLTGVVFFVAVFFITAISVAQEQPQQDGQIVFVSNRDGNSEIYVMNSDGSGVKRLTDDEESDLSPQWSPDGGKIVFVSGRDGNPEIYAMDADGSNVKRLTVYPGEDNTPSWSPDGSKIVFISDRDGNSEIYVMDADGSNIKRITKEKDYDGEPSWSADGQKIAFVSTRKFFRCCGLYTMNPQGAKLKLITQTPHDSGTFLLGPDWSQDGTRIVFNSDKNRQTENDDDIYAINSDGSNELRLTYSPSFDANPSWSSDGKKIIFDSREQAGNSQIYVIDSDGSNQRRISASSDWADWSPSWSPAGQSSLAIDKH